MIFVYYYEHNLKNFNLLNLKKRACLGVKCLFFTNFISFFNKIFRKRDF